MAALPVLPFWLTDTARPVTIPKAIDEKFPDEEEAAIDSKPTQTQILHHGPQTHLSDDLSLVTQALLLATDVDHVRRVIDDRAKISRVSSGPEDSELIFQRLLDLHAPTDVLIDFLANPAMGFSGARIIQKIFQYFGQQPITEPMYMSLASMLKQAMALGL